MVIGFLYSFCILYFNIILGCDAITGCSAGKSLMLINPPHTWLSQLLLQRRQMLQVQCLHHRQGRKSGMFLDTPAPPRTQSETGGAIRELPSILPANLGGEAQEQQPPDPQVAALAQWHLWMAQHLFVLKDNSQCPKRQHSAFIPLWYHSPSQSSSPPLGIHNHQRDHRQMSITQYGALLEPLTEQWAYTWNILIADTASYFKFSSPWDNHFKTDYMWSCVSCQDPAPQGPMDFGKPLLLKRAWLLVGSSICPQEKSLWE